jgi:uncharacterized protein (DUF302 family)
MSADSQQVAYASPGTVSNEFQRGRICPLPLSDVLWRLREAIEVADLWILHEIDPQLLLRRGGYEIGTARQILFFHPRYVVRMLAADPTSLPEAPLKFTLLALADGTTMLRWFDPAAAFGRYGNPALSALGIELAELCEKLAAIDSGEP